MSFVNTLPYISHPIEEFSDFKFVSWEKDIYPKFKGGTKPEEISFFTNLIVGHHLKDILDLGVGGGTELSGIVEELNNQNYKLNSFEANEVDEDYITQAQKLFKSKNQNVTIHQANWLDLPQAQPDYSHKFEFAF